MKAICVTPSRDLDVRDVPAPEAPAPGHVLIDMDGAAINHGDKTFLKMPTAAGNALAARQHDVWGASGAGRVVAVGAGVPKKYEGRQVAVYRSLGFSQESVGLWCETAQMPYTSCLILPETVRARDYSGSLVNVMTAYAFLEEVAAAGHKGVIATAGNAATGHALAALAKQRGMPAIFLVRSKAAQEAMQRLGVEHVIATGEGFTAQLGTLAAELGTTAVFDGVGGALLGQIAPVLPMNSTIYFYGFLGGMVPIAIESRVFMMKNLTMRRFSNFDTATVKEHGRLAAALAALEEMIADPMFATRIGKEFAFADIEAAMAYDTGDGSKAVLVGSKQA